jgi:hypothetical protein
MAQSKRIYAVSNADGIVIALINAASPTQALHAAVRNQYYSKVATPAQLIGLTKLGMEVQELSKPAEEAAEEVSA